MLPSDDALVCYDSYVTLYSTDMDAEFFGELIDTKMLTGSLDSVIVCYVFSAIKSILMLESIKSFTDFVKLQFMTIDGSCN